MHDLAWFIFFVSLLGKTCEVFEIGKRGPSTKLVVRLSSVERTDLEEMIRKGIGAAYRLLKARILLRADVSEAGPGWPDPRITGALEPSPSTVLRTR